MPLPAREQVDQIIESGAAQPLVDYVNKTFTKKSMQRGMLREYLWPACEIFQPFLRLREERQRQDEYLDALIRDFTKFEKHDSKDGNVQDFIKVLRAKKYIACQHSNYAQRGNKDLSGYALAFFLNHSFSFLNTEARKKLIANLLVLSGLSSAVCFEIKGDKMFRQFFPAIFRDGRIKISGKKIPFSKLTVHKACPAFPGNADTSVLEGTHCGEKFCYREAIAFTKRWKRAEQLFRPLLSSEDYHEYLKANLSAIKRAQKGPARPLGRKAVAWLRLCIKGAYLMWEFRKLSARLVGPTNIYIDELADLLRKNGIPGYRAHDFYKDLTRDRKFWSAFNVTFWSVKKSKAS